MVFVSICGKAQEQSKRDKIDALRIAFITKEVNLTSAEAQSFWPIYNEYLDKLEAIRKNFRKSYNKSTNYDFKTDKEAEDYINAEIALRQSESNLLKEYYEKFKKVLPVKKVAKLRHAEEEFKKELLKQLKGNPTD